MIVKMCLCDYITLESLKVLVQLKHYGLKSYIPTFSQNFVDMGLVMLEFCVTNKSSVGLHNEDGFTPVK